MQEWVRADNQRIVIIFEGRDAAGKGGAIKRITQYLNPRLRASPRFRRLPSGNRVSGTSRGTSSTSRRRPDGAVRPQLVQPRRRRARPGLLHRRRVPHVPAPSTRSSNACSSRTESCCASTGSASARRSKTKRFTHDWTTRCDAGSSHRWTPKSIKRWDDYSRAKDEMFIFTDITEAPWYVVEADEKKQSTHQHDRPPAVDAPLLDQVEQKTHRTARASQVNGLPAPERDHFNYVPDHAATLE